MSDVYCKGCLIRDVDLDRVGRELRDAEMEIATLRAQLAAVEKERNEAQQAARLAADRVHSVCQCGGVMGVHAYALHPECEHRHHHCDACHERGHCTATACREGWARAEKERDAAIASERAHVVEIAAERDAHDRLAGELRRGYVTAQAEAAAMRSLLDVAAEYLRCDNEPPCDDEDEPAPREEWCSFCSLHERIEDALGVDARRPFLALLDAARAFLKDLPGGWPEFEQLRAAVAAIDGGESK